MARTTLVTYLLAAIVGCGSPARSPNEPPLGPAPTVGPNPNYPGSYLSEGLPGIARDGQSVMLAVVADDGARAAPNLALVEKDRDDKVVRTMVVQVASDELPPEEGDPLAPEIVENLAEANRLLAETHGSRGWLPLAPMTVEESVEQDMYGHTTRRSAQGSGVTLTWDEGKVGVTVGGRKVIERLTQGWTAPVGERCPGCGVCANPSYLGEAWVDAERRLIVISIAYHGTDACWEPNRQEHIVSW